MTVACNALVVFQWKMSGDDDVSFLDRSLHDEAQWTENSPVFPDAMPLECQWRPIDRIAFSARKVTLQKISSIK